MRFEFFDEKFDCEKIFFYLNIYLSHLFSIYSDY